MKPLNLKGYRGRQLQKSLNRHLGLLVPPLSRMALFARGEAIHVWVVTPEPTPAPNRAAELPSWPQETVQHNPWRGLTPQDSLRFDWATYNETMPGDPLGTPALMALSRQAIRSVVMAGDTSTLGLAVDEFNSLRAVLGEGMLGDKQSESSPPAASVPSALLAWLWSFRRSDSPWTRAVAGALACASMGPRHLWVELGLTGRDPINTLIAGHFPVLYRQNITHMGWKKFFSTKCPALQQLVLASQSARGRAPAPASTLSRKSSQDHAVG